MTLSRISPATTSTNRPQRNRRDERVVRRDESSAPSLASRSSSAVRLAQRTAYRAACAQPRPTLSSQTVTLGSFCGRGLNRRHIGAVCDEEQSFDVAAMSRSDRESPTATAWSGSSPRRSRSSATLRPLVIPRAIRWYTWIGPVDAGHRRTDGRRPLSTSVSQPIATLGQPPVDLVDVDLPVQHDVGLMPEVPRRVVLEASLDLAEQRVDQTDRLQLRDQRSRRTRAASGR